MLRAFFYKAIVATNPTTAAPKNEVESAPILYNPRRCAGIVAPPGKELDPDHVPQFGLVAEEVEKVNPDLVAREEDGKAMTIRYEAVNAMLLNEFLKEHQKVEEQGAAIAQMKRQIEALTATVQKISDRQ